MGIRASYRTKESPKRAILPRAAEEWNQLFNSTLSLLHSKQLGYRVVPFCPFSCWVPLLNPSRREKGILIIQGLLENLDRGAKVCGPQVLDMRLPKGCIVVPFWEHLVGS